jgi:predicted metal-dependent hydrolase
LKNETYTLIRSKRRSIALIVQSDGSLVVRAPLRATLRQIQELLTAKADWIRQKQDLARRTPPPAAHHFAPGESFWFLGKMIPLEVEEGKLTTALKDANAKTQRRALKSSSVYPLCLCGDNHFQISPTALTQAKEHFVAWYKVQARQVIEERVRYFAARFGLRYSGVRITSAQTRWGSCSSRGALSFTWRLVMAPPASIDYVVVHELTHLLVRNHSPAFWRKLEELLPDYRPPQQWLKHNGHLLNL